MTLDRFKQVCEDHGLNVIDNPDCNYTYARAFYKNEVVAVYHKN